MNVLHEEARDEEERSAAVVPSIPSTTHNVEKTFQNQLAIYIILAVLLLERIAFYSIVANLTVSLGNNFLGWRNANVLTAEFIFTGISYFSTVIFAILSDAKLGRAKTILFGFFVYIVGFILAILTTHPKGPGRLCKKRQTITDVSQGPSISHELCAPAVLTTIIVIALGAGAVQSNMAVLGAEQIQESQIASRYFDKYMVAVNIGGVIAKLTLSFTHIDVYHYYIVYAVALAALVCATTLFLSGWKCYRHVQPYDSVITKCFPVIINAFQTWYQFKKKKHSLTERNANFSGSSSVNTIQNLSEQGQLNQVNQTPSTFLDFAKAINGGKFNDRIVDDVKSLINATAGFVFFIPYFIIYHQVNSSFPLQGRYMKTFSEQPLVAWVSLADPITIIMGILILQVLIYKRWDAQNKHMSIVTKILIGMAFGCIAMCLAGSVEIARQNTNVSSLLIYAQIPQYTTMGLSEIFAMTASYEFAYYAARRSAQSLLMSLRFFLLGVLSFIGALCIYIYTQLPNKPISESNEESRQWILYTYFFGLAGLQFLCMVIFTLCRKKRRFIKLNFEN